MKTKALHCAPTSASTRQATDSGTRKTGRMRIAVNRSMSWPAASAEMTVMVDMTANEAAKASCDQPRSSTR